MEPAFQTPIAFLERISYTVATQPSQKVFCELQIHFTFVNSFIKIHLIPLKTIKKNIWDENGGFVYIVAFFAQNCYNAVRMILIYFSGKEKV